MALIDDLNTAVAAVVAKLQADAAAASQDAATIASLQAQLAGAVDPAQVQAVIATLQSALNPTAV